MQVSKTFFLGFDHTVLADDHGKDRCGFRSHHGINFSLSVGYS